MNVGWNEYKDIKETLKDLIEKGYTVSMIQQVLEENFEEQTGTAECEYDYECDKCNNYACEKTNIVELSTIPQTVTTHNTDEIVDVKMSYENKEFIINAPNISQTEYEWCKGCKECDTENHCCHRYSSFIRYSLQDNIDGVLKDIKAELYKEIENDFDVDYCSGLYMAIEVIDKYISGK